MVLGTQDKSCVIVGRGPSLGQNDARWIDSHEIVVRLSNGRRVGSQCDIMFTHYLEIPKALKWDFGELWFYDIGARKKVVDYTVFDEIINENVHGTPKITHVCEVIRKWIAEYQLIADPLSRNHKHVVWPSKGTAAALMAKEIFHPGQIDLIGMDNVLEGKRTYHCHDWWAENRLLKEAGII